jgi:iron complex outermembrane receptor protein
LAWTTIGLVDSKDKKGTSRIEDFRSGIFIFRYRPIDFDEREIWIMGKLWVLGIGIIMISAMGPAALAQDDQKETQTTLEEVVVTARGQAEETTRVPSNISVVTAEEIEDSTAANVAEVLTEAGIQVSDISGNRRNYSVDLRGFGESSAQNILLLVDGRRVNLDDLSGADWNTIPLDRIARIEVIRGSRGTVLYGDNATAGVVNIITKEGDRSGITAGLAYGSYATLKGHTAVSGATDTMAFDITGSYLHSDGYRDNSGSIAKDVGANLKVDPSDRFRMHLSTGYHHDHTHNPGRLFQTDFDSGLSRTDSATPYDFDKVDDYYLKAGFEMDLTADQLIKLETSVRNRDKESFGTFSGGYFETETGTWISSATPQLVLTHAAGRLANRMIVGADFRKSKQNFDNVSEFFGTPSQIIASLEKYGTAYFIQDDLGIGRYLSLSGGYRSDRATFSYKPVRSSRTLDENSYNFGINYVLKKNSHVYANYSRGFRFPVLDEQFSYFTSTLDTSLMPQTSDNYEVGASIDIGPRLVAGVNLFRIETEDEIFFNNNTYANENMEGTSLRQGAEFSLAYQDAAFYVGGTYTRTNTDFDGGPNDGKQVPFVPEDKATAKISYAFGWGLTLGVNAVYVGERFFISDFDNSFEKEDAHTVVNAKIQYDWRGLTFFADLNNLFNEEYNTYSVIGYNSATFDNQPAVYPAPEFNAMVGIKAFFGM